MIIVSVCFVITSFLFNLSVAVTEDYARQKLYVARNRYDESFTTIQIGSVYPLSDILPDPRLTELLKIPLFLKMKYIICRPSLWEII
mgnify:CR=1 FL=1